MTTISQNSSIVGGLRRLREYLQPAFEQSAILERLSKIRRVVADVPAFATTPFGQWLKGVSRQSHLWALGGTVRERLITAAATAELLSVGPHLQTATSNSGLYRWLTAEPEPEVIVIDLRETWSVGPVVEVIDRTLREVMPAVPTAALTGVGRRITSFGRHRPIRAGSLGVLTVVLLSLVGGIVLGTLSASVVGGLVAVAVAAVGGLRSRTTLEELRDNRVVCLLVAMFEPPEPPEPSEQSGPPASMDQPTETQESTAEEARYRPTSTETASQPEGEDEDRAEGEHNDEWWPY